MTLGPIYTKPDFRVLQSRTTSSGKNEEWGMTPNYVGRFGIAWKSGSV
jgi:hypothetical protein